MRRLPHRKRREDGHDVGSVLPVAARQAGLLTTGRSNDNATGAGERLRGRPPEKGKNHGRRKHVDGTEYVEGDGKDGARWPGRSSVHADERAPELHHPLSPVAERYD